MSSLNDVASEIVRISFPLTGGRVVEAEFPYIRGKTIRHYLKDPTLRRYGPIGLRLGGRKIRLTNQRNEKLRLTYVPRPGDEIVLVVQPR